MHKANVYAIGSNLAELPHKNDVKIGDRINQRVSNSIHLRKDVIWPN
jgi:hypothetical protein